MGKVFFFLYHTVNGRVECHVSQYLRKDSHELTIIFICLFIGFFFETGSSYVAQVGIKLGVFISTSQVLGSYMVYDATVLS